MHVTKRFPVRLAVAASSIAALAMCLPTAAAAPLNDAQGYVDSWARCEPPSSAVIFGSTDSSRVAICKGADGQYQYRGVRVRDGAKLAVEAGPSGNDGYVAENEGIAYTVTPSGLLVSVDHEVIRDEEWVDYHGPAGAQSDASSTPTPTTPLPPPLPAEEGGGG